MISDYSYKLREIIGGGYKYENARIMSLLNRIYLDIYRYRFKQLSQKLNKKRTEYEHYTNKRGTD